MPGFKTGHPFYIISIAYFRKNPLKAMRTVFSIVLVIVISLACRRSALNTAGTQSSHVLIYQDIERSYTLYTPANFDNVKPVPVVFVLHGGGGNAEIVIKSSDFNKIADEHGVLIVYPNGSGRFNDSLLTWNGGSCCGYAQENNVDDVGFIRAVLEDLKAGISINPKQVYATGMSNGAMMSYRLGCEASDIFAAIAPVAGTLNFSPCTPSETISVMHFHGTDDQHVPYEGGVGPESPVGVDFASVQDSVNFWALFNGCNSQPQTNSLEDVQHQAWVGCGNSSSVELYTITGGKHAWPGSAGPGWAGGDEPSQSISATQLMWDFFAAHPKP